MKEAGQKIALAGDGQFDSVGEDWFITSGLRFRVLELEIVVVPRMIRKS